MYVIQRKNKDGSIGYYTYDGWCDTPSGESLDLSNVVRFTEREAKANELEPNHTFQWFGSYI